MERLGHRITLAFDYASWHPFRLIQGGFLISHIFFADDLILYAKTIVDQVVSINHILVDFGYFSGHKVNKLKSQVYFSPNTNAMMAHSVLTTLGIKQVSDLGVYLGMLVMHKRATCEFYNFIIDKLRTKLEGWSARSLFLANRVTFLMKLCYALAMDFKSYWARLLQ
ncbi:hypothetical protein GQ457_11G022370 [Hibiscus cannabinus]